MNTFFFVTITTLAITISTVSAYSCLDESGNEVDWFVAFKENDGADYYYADAKKPSTLRPASQAMDGMEGGSVVDTINQIYDDFPSDYGYLLYNDQTDEGKASSSYAHAKGVILFDNEKGFWIIHSLPRYPSRPSKGYEGLPDTTYGQTFMCVTFKTAEFDKIGAQLDMMHPQKYDWDLVGLDDVVPAFADYIDASRTKAKQTSNVMTLTSAGGKKFTHFAKSKKFEGEGNLYETLVAAGLKKAIYVETWMNGALANKMHTVHPSSGYDVIQVSNVKMSDGTEWRETQDHSKWAVTVKPGSVCIGDINRQYSQVKRGGGTLCLDDKPLWGAVSAIVDQVDDDQMEVDEDEDGDPMDVDDVASSSFSLHPVVIGAAAGVIAVVATVLAIGRRRRARAADASHYRSFVVPQPQPSVVV